MHGYYSFGAVDVNAFSFCLGRSSQAIQKIANEKFCRKHLFLVCMCVHYEQEMKMKCEYQRYKKRTKTKNHKQMARKFYI